MFENIRISELFPDEFALIEQFVSDMQEHMQAIAKIATGAELLDVNDMEQSARIMLQRLAMDRRRRSIGQQAAQAGQARAQQIAQKQGGAQAFWDNYDQNAIKSRYQALKAQAGNFNELMKGPAHFGSHLEEERMEFLRPLVRKRLQQHLGPNAPLGLEISGGAGIRQLYNLLEGFEGNPYENMAFKRTVKSMRREIGHLIATRNAANNPTKKSIDLADLTFGNCTVLKIVPTTYTKQKATKTEAEVKFTVPNSLIFEIAYDTGQKNMQPVKVKIEIQGMNSGGKPPMSKHLKDYLDSFGPEATIFDAIAYCRSWLADLARVPMSDYSGIKGQGSMTFYSPPPMRWEYMFRRADNYTTAQYICFHVVAKGLQTGLNPFHINT